MPSPENPSTERSHESPHYTVTAMPGPGAVDDHFFPYRNQFTGIYGLGMIIEIKPEPGIPDIHWKFVGGQFKPPVEIEPLHEVKGDKALYFDLATEDTGEDAKDRLRAARMMIEAVMNVAEDPAAYYEARYGGPANRDPNEPPRFMPEGPVDDQMPASGDLPGPTITDDELRSLP